MSKEFAIIRQPAGQRTLALRESYLAICDEEECEAYLLNANERWYAWKLAQRQQVRHNKVAKAGGEVPEDDESLWVFMSAAEWVKELLNIYDEKTIRKKLARLVKRGYLATRNNPKKKWDRKPQWLFCCSAVQAAVDAWEATRTSPDPAPPRADEAEDADQDDSGNEGNSIRENARVQSGKVPSAVGKSSASIRENTRSNTTGISPRDLSQEAFPGGVKSVTGDASAPAQLTEHPPLVDEASPATCSSGEAALQKTEGAPFGSSPQALMTVPRNSEISAVLQQPPPEGGAAEAAEGLDVPSTEELESMLVGQSGNTPTTETVPGAAAGRAAVADGPSGGGDRAKTTNVNDLVPIPHEELLRRPRASVDTATYQALRKLVGENLEKIIGESTRTASILRAEFWPRLTLAEIGEAQLAAQIEARATQNNERTLRIRALDRLIGGGSRPKATPKPDTQAYNGGALVAAKKVEEPQEEPRRVVGARWRNRKGGDLVDIVDIERVQGKIGTTDHYRLSNGCLLNAMTLAQQFEFVPTQAAD